MGASASIQVSLDSDPDKCNGDNAFKLGQYGEAILFYSRSIISYSNFENTPNRTESLAILYSNRSAAYESIAQYSRALDDAKEVISLRPDWERGYYRAAKAVLRIESGGLKESQDYIEKALSLNRADRSILSFCKTLNSAEQDLDFQYIKRGIGWTFCWGNGQQGQLGNNSLQNRSLPYMVNKLRGKYMLDISCGASHTVAVSMSGEVYGW